MAKGHGCRWHHVHPHPTTTQHVTTGTTPTIAAMITITGPTAGGNATVYPTSTGKPATSNWGTTDLVIDSSGYHT